MTANEIREAVKLMKAASDDLGNRGCNDYEIDDTPENREMIERMRLWNDPKCPEEDRKPNVYRKKILTQDYFLLDYLTAQLEKLLTDGKHKQ